MDIVATLLQLVGGVLLAIDAFIGKEALKQLESTAKLYVEREFTSIDSFKKQFAKRLFVRYLLIVAIAVAMTAASPSVVQWVIYLPFLSIESSMLAGFLIGIAWLFSITLVLMGFLYFSPSFLMLTKHYVGVFLLVSERGPLYVLGFLFLVSGYAKQLYLQVSVTV